MTKAPVTVRLSKESQLALKKLAERDGSTVSNLINQAVEQYLASQGQGTSESNHDTLLTVEDVEGMIPVIKALGRPMSIRIFLQLVQVRRNNDV